ncbi:hypothetical protein [Halomonas sp. H5]|uniref:hypothetical protein n=1 Tax=Halomonas sp. H5 TaxID=3423910 RepID=UPI003D36AC3B
METLGRVLLLAALAILYFGFTMDVTTSGSRIVNSDLLSLRGSIITLGGLMIVTSAVMVGFGQMIGLHRESVMTHEERVAKEQRAEGNKKVSRILLGVLVASAIAGKVFGLW